MDQSERARVKKLPPYTWIAPVNAAERVRDGVHHVVAEQRDVARVQLLAPGRDHVRPATFAPVEGVVLLPAVDRDRGPHPMVVRLQPHAGRPHRA